MVEVVPYGGPVNGAILRKHQEWYRLARTKTARHKIMRFLRENAALAASKGIKLMPAPGGWPVRLLCACALLAWVWG